MRSVWDRVQALLEGVAVRVIEHEEFASADEAAARRGTPLAIGGKAILLRPGSTGFAVCALSAATELDSKLLRRVLGVRRLRFATTDELLLETGLVPGTVPPFGEPIFPFPLFVDTLLVAEQEIAFTAGRRDRSLVISMADYLRLGRPRVVAFARRRS